MPGALAVFAGGGLGALLRYAVGLWSLAWFGSGFPVATIAVNVVGCFAMGLAIGALAGVGEGARLFFVTGLLGGFTTFSAFSLDALTLWHRGQHGTAITYVLASVLLSLAAVGAGYATSR